MFLATILAYTIVAHINIKVSTNVYYTGYAGYLIASDLLVKAAKRMISISIEAIVLT